MKDSFTTVSKKVYDYIEELENEYRELKRLLKKSESLRKKAREDFYSYH